MQTVSTKLGQYFFLIIALIARIFTCLTATPPVIPWISRWIVQAVMHLGPHHFIQQTTICLQGNPRVWPYLVGLWAWNRQNHRIFDSPTSRWWQEILGQSPVRNPETDPEGDFVVSQYWTNKADILDFEIEWYQRRCRRNCDLWVRLKTRCSDVHVGNPIIILPVV